MSKGYLDAKQLEGYKKADLVELAKKLGVDTEGTVKELAARCASVEVELDDEPEDAESEPEADKDDTAKVKLVVIQTYNDLQLKRMVEVNEEITVTNDRAALLIERNLAKRV